jgi:hypothetical protein
MTPLRQPYTEDLQIRNYSPRTVECYVYHVASFAKHFGRSPEQRGPEEVHAYQVYLVRQLSGRSRIGAAQPTADQTGIIICDGSGRP